MMGTVSAVEAAISRWNSVSWLGMEHLQPDSNREHIAISQVEQWSKEVRPAAQKLEEDNGCQRRLRQGQDQLQVDARLGCPVDSGGVGQLTQESS